MEKLELAVKRRQCGEDRENTSHSYSQPLNISGRTHE